MMPARPTTVPIAARPKKQPSRLAFLLAAASAIARLWVERARQRHALGGLDADRLEDLGLSRSAAVREAEKPFWKA